ncbi:hypothetical protein Daus18300_008057 [Diaporthe australafricana]|uniref:Uncharacterized protein n=1 Tax=Diaporthe australafricana TaxID=127596 RepID=A0ABR3WK13_9PEZI
MAKVNLSGPIPDASLAGQPDATSLKDSTVLVTGGAQGLGAEIATQCIAAGAYVTIADIDDTKGKSLASSLGAHAQFVQCDVTKWSEQVSAFKAAIRFAPSSKAPTTALDHLIINAGVMDKPFFIGTDTGMTNLDDDPLEPDATPIDVNTKGAMFSLKLAQLYMASVPNATEDASSRSVVFVLSPESYVTLPGSVIYGGSKFGARGLFRSSRIPFASKGVRVNALVPWLMETGMNAGGGGLTETLNSLGVYLVSVDLHARVVLHLLSDRGIAGRAVAVGQPDGEMLMDVEDDDAGGDGVKKFWELLHKGWPEAKEGRRKMYGMMGFQDEEDVWF